MQPLNVINSYYGEKMGFYYAWMIHYTAWLIPLSLVATIYAVLTIYFRVEHKDWDYENLFNTQYGFLYSLAVIIWLTLFELSWRRK